MAQRMTNEEINDWVGRHGGGAAQKENAPSNSLEAPTITITTHDGSKITFATASELVNGQWVYAVPEVDERKKPASAASQAPPREKDEGGRRYVYNEDTNRWEDVGAAPPNAQERAQAEAERAERERQAALERQATQQAEANRLAQERLNAEREARAADDRRADAAANRPQIVSAPSNARRIAQMDAAGNITSVDNPNFDEAAYERQAAKEKAQAERDRLALQIEAGKLTEATAAAQYKRWFDENVTIPLQRAQEARAQAAELRAAQEAEDRRQQYAASYEKDRQTTAISAGNQAAQTFNSNLQYQVGPKFGEQFAQALNSFQPGAPPATFTKDAFTFKGPSIEAVARKATAKALAGISPYAKAIATAGQREPIVAGPGPAIGGAPPPAAAAPDYQGIIDQYLQSNPYVPGGGDEEDQ